MVSGVDTALIIRVNSAFAGAAFGQRDDAGIPFNSITENAALPGLGDRSQAALIRPFGNGEPEEGADEGPFFSTGLNGLLAPPSIAAIQEEDDGSAGDGRGDASGEGRGIAQPSEPADGAGPEAAAADGEEETGPGELTEEEEEQVQELKQRDAEVRRHEQAHKAVGGQYAGSISYTYEAGPDGRRYAVGGEVPIDASPIAGDPEATIRKLEQVRRAALAPAEPSGADRAVASQASQGIQQARAEQAQERAEELEELTGGGDDAAEAAPESASAPDAATDGAEPAPAGAESPFAAGGGATEPSNAASASGTPNRSEGSDGGTFGAEPSDNRAPERTTGADTGGRSPFDFNPFAGRTTLDVSV